MSIRPDPKPAVFDGVTVLAALRDAVTAFATARDATHLADLACRHAASLLEAPAASLLLRDADAFVPQAWYGLSLATSAWPRVPVRQVADAFRDRRSCLVTPDLRQEAGPYRLLVEGERLRSSLTVTLESSGRLIGLLSVFSRDEPREFTPEDIHLLGIIASAVAPAIENLSLVTRESNRTAALAAVLASMRDGMVTVDARGHIVEVNDEAWRLLGYPNRDALSGPLADCLEHVNARDAMGNPLTPEATPAMRALRGEVVHAVPIVFRRADSGEERDALLSSAPIRVEHGAIEAAVC
jgi:PAS domain S-box-containing protein